MSQQLRYARTIHTSSSFESALLAPDVSEVALKVDEQVFESLNQETVLNSISVTFNFAESSSVEELYREGWVYFVQKKWLKAVEIFTELVSLMQTSEMYSLLGLSYFRLGDLERAANALEKATRLRLGNGYAQLCLGIVYLTYHTRYGNQDKLRKAVQPLRRAIQLDCQKAHAYLYLGIVYRNLRNWEGAEAAFQEAIKLEANFSDAYERLGKLYLEIGDSNEPEREEYFLKAIQTLEKLTEIKPGRSDIHHYIGYINRRLGNLEAALKAFGKAAEVEGVSFIALSALGVMYLDLKRYKDAMPVFERIIGSDVQVVAANIAREAERHGKDVNNFRSDAYTCYGVACMELFRTQSENERADKADLELLHKAESAFKEAIKLDPNCIKAHFDLAVLYLWENRLDEAKEPMRRMLEIDPGNQDIKQKAHSLSEDLQRLMEVERPEEIKTLTLDGNTPLSETGLESAAKVGDESAFLDALKEVEWQARPATDFVRAVHLALEAGAHLAARKISAEGAKLHPNDSELQKYARVLAPPKVISTNIPPNPTQGTNLEWLKDHTGEYRGKWVAVKDGRLLGSADSLKELITQVGDTKGKGILVTTAY